MPPVIEVTDLVREFGGRRVLNGISFQCRVANKSGKERANKSGNVSLKMRDLERRRVEKNKGDGII